MKPENPIAIPDAAIARVPSATDQRNEKRTDKKLKLTLEAGPKFTGDAEATRMLTRDVYRKPYVV